MAREKSVIYKELNRIRVEKGMTRVELAELMNMDINTIDKYLSGKRDPNTRKTKALAASLNCTVGELFGENRAT